MTLDVPEKFPYVTSPNSPILPQSQARNSLFLLRMPFFLLIILLWPLQLSPSIIALPTQLD